MLKKATLAALSLAFNGLATAGLYSPPPTQLSCTSNYLSILCEEKKWEIGAQALYLKPVYNGGNAYDLATTEGLKKIDPNWGWGYRLGGAYHFNTGNDLGLDWSHYDVKSNLGLFNGQYLQLIPPTALRLAATYNASVTNRFDQVNLILGQQVGFGFLKNVHFYAGMQYVDIRADFSRFYNISPLFITATGGGVKDAISIDFNGAGPVIGIDYAYFLTPRLSLTANTAAAILYGSSRYDLTSSYLNSLVVSSIYGSKKNIVPGLELKLGANYDYQIAQGLLSVEGGYQALNYFNALQARSFLSDTLTTSYFGLFGPYFGIKWLGDI